MKMFTEKSRILEIFQSNTYEEQSKDASQNLIDLTEFSIKNLDEPLKAIHTILLKIKDDVTNEIEGLSNVEQIVLGQTLKGGYLIEDIREDLNKPPPDTEKIHSRTDSLLYLLQYSSLYRPIIFNPSTNFPTQPQF